MHVSPRFLGAASLVLVTGVASGAVIGKVPPMQYLGADYFLPQTADGTVAWSEQKPLPDHYPIVTPEGRFEVYQLSERGLFRTARYAPQHAVYAYDFDAADPAYNEPGTALAGEPVPADDRLAAAAEPLELAVPATVEPVAEVALPPAATDAAVVAAPETGSPRVIDVAAELAARS